MASSSKHSDDATTADPRFSFLSKAIRGLCGVTVDQKEITALANVEQVRSFLDDASCRVLRISTVSASKLVASNILDGVVLDDVVDGGRAVSFVKVGIQPLSPDNIDSQVMVTSHGKNQTPLRNLYSAVHNLYAPTLLDNDHWSAQLGDKLQELLAKLDTSLGAVVNNENDNDNDNDRNSRSGRSSGEPESELYGSFTSILTMTEEFQFWSEQTSTGSGRVRSAGMFEYSL